MRTYRAENVDGNWDSYASLEYSSPLDKRRTETWTNTLPRYVMLHVAYRLKK